MNKTSIEKNWSLGNQPKYEECADGWIPCSCDLLCMVSFIA